MSILFMPKRLLEEQQIIKAEHPYVDGQRRRKYENRELKNLIERMAKKDPRKLKKEAFALSNSEVIAIAGYTPSNAYGVKRENLHLILYYRSEKEFWEEYFLSWQDYYNEEECNIFLKQNFSRDEEFQKMIEAHNIGKEAFRHLMESENVPVALGRYIWSNTFPIKGTFSERLGYLGIREDTRLYNDCEYLFYTYCGRDDYIRAEKSRLLNVITKYNEQNQAAFLVNFLSLLSLTELDTFKELALYYQKEIGDRSSARYEKLSGLSEELKLKYFDWINRLRIDTYFGKDERSLFWRRYRFKTIRKNMQSQSLTMEFENHYVVEFLGRSNGPLYIYEKQYFEDIIRYWTLKETNTELRRTLYNKKWTKRVEHRGSWQAEVRDYLKYNRIAERIS